MAYQEQKAKVITDRLFRNWIRCRRKAWLDLHGDANQRIWTPHRSLQLDHQQRSFVALIPQKPEKGIQGCRNGAHAILGLRIKGESNGEAIEVHPPILQKIKGQSKWGDFAYKPVIARQGRRLTREHKLVIGLIALLLEPFQNFRVTNGVAVCATNKGLEIDEININESLKSQVLDILGKARKGLLIKTPPPLTTDRKKCSICAWQNVCNQEASSIGHLSEVIGIGHRRRQILEEIGIKNIEDLANSDEIELGKNLAKYGEQHKEIAYEIISQAKIQRTGDYERIDFTNSLPEIKDSRGLFIYDIESDPDAQEDFLHGFLTIQRDERNQWNIKKAKYEPILLSNSEDESLLWKKLRSKLHIHPSWPILHYGETESLAICRLAERQGIGNQELLELKSRCIDIHARIRKYWRLPVNSYGLKTVAKLIGFQWRNKSADGSKALLWWRQYKANNEEKIRAKNTLNKILEYNFDDCIATWEVASWMLENE